MANEIEKLFNSHSIEAYSRFDDLHPFNIYLGVNSNGRKSMAIILDASREKVTSSKTISVEFFKRDDHQNMMRFDLDDDELKDMFYRFCEDLIESTKDRNPDEGFHPFVERWNTWVKFFSKSTLPLSENEILGLIGEIHFLQYFMIEKYGLEDAMAAYIGTDLAHKDFEISDTWYEVKSIHNGVRSIKISSIEQLDSTRLGELVVLTFDQASSSAKERITLNSIVSNLIDSLDRKWKLQFAEKLRKTGYVKDERYDEYIYQFIGLDEYRVSATFPRLNKAELPKGVTKASYEIDVSALKEFKVRS